MKSLLLKAAVAALSLSSLTCFADYKADAQKNENNGPIAYLCESVDPTLKVFFQFTDRSHVEKTFWGNREVVTEGDVFSIGSGDIYLNHQVDYFSEAKHDANLINFRIRRLDAKAQMKEFDGFVTLNMANLKMDSKLYLPTIQRPIELACERASKFMGLSEYIKERRSLLSQPAGPKTKKVEEQGASGGAFDLTESLDQLQEKINKLNAQIAEQNNTIQELTNGLSDDKQETKSTDSSSEKK